MVPVLLFTHPIRYFVVGYLHFLDASFPKIDKNFFLGSLCRMDERKIKKKALFLLSLMPDLLHLSFPFCNLRVPKDSGPEGLYLTSPIHPIPKACNPFTGFSVFLKLLFGKKQVGMG